MRILRSLAVSLLAVAAAIGVPTTTAVADPSWSVQLDHAHVETTIGHHFTFTSALHNATGRTRPGTVAYLNIVSMDPSVYVDPEDWSSSRTRYLGDVGPGATVPVTWRVQAVNSGRFVIFVVVTSQRGSDEVVTSGAMRVTIANQRRLNPSGILPVALGVPTVAGALLVWTRRRRQRLR